MLLNGFNLKASTCLKIINVTAEQIVSIKLMSLIVSDSKAN